MDDTNQRFTDEQQGHVISGSEQDKAQANREQARQKARDAASQARDEAYKRADEQKAYVADQIDNFSEAVRSMGSQFKEQNQITMADYTFRLSARADSLADTLRDKDSQSLVRQVQDFSKREPALFIGGMVAGGFLLSRFLKSSNNQN
ncbi:hypothetical protein [Larsenimonas salina]|uniref:hypothetical protein n=1 Tax=Larsenimonas salina TaxID=1295565 RepID=UPI0020737D41|nr:hypothetical protein [Larsenimonas salina]MCM5704533.1 hypothetical protein [Larsenimonas salina]